MKSHSTAAPACDTPRCRMLRTLSALACALGIVLALAPTPAGAKVVHLQEGSFNGVAAPESPFGGVLTADAVDNSTGPSAGDVYVLESNAFGFGKGLIDKFTEKGKYAGVQIAGSATPQGSFSFGFAGSGLAVDSSGAANRGDLYVADTGNGVVDRFSESGTFLCQITARKPASLEEEQHECNGAAGSEPTGGPAGFEPTGLAVDSSGDLYVADQAHAAIDKFGPSGQFLEQITDPHLSGAPGMIALDSSGNLYVVDGSALSPGPTLKFHNGTFVTVIDSNSTVGVGVDPGNAHVYVSDSLENPSTNQTEVEITEYEPSGALLDVFNKGPETQAFGGLAVNAESGRLYAAEVLNFSGAKVQIFGGDIVVPTVTTNPAAEVEETSATVSGEVDPDAAEGGGEIAECQFEYGPTKAYGFTAPCSPKPPYSSPGQVSAELKGLGGSTTYHFRLSAANSDKTPGQSEDKTFTTAGRPSIDRESAVVSGREANFKAEINPFGLDTSCVVQYVDEADFQASKYADATTVPCAPQDLGEGFGDREASAKAEGLRVGTIYHYRFLVTNRAGLTGHADQTFVTVGIHAVQFEVVNEEGEGHPYSQAGGHPYELRANFEVNDNFFEKLIGERNEDHYRPNSNLKTILTKLPPGLIGNPDAVSKCTRHEVFDSKCSGAAQVGTFEYEEVSAARGYNSATGIYDVYPPRGVAAEFATIAAHNVIVTIEAGVNSGGDYRVIAESPNIPALAPIQAVKLAFWGVPSDPSHDAKRFCPVPGQEEGEVSPCSANQSELKPFLTDPTSCSGPLTTILGADSWQTVGEFDEHVVETPPITGCNKLEFNPTLEALPTTNLADSATGLHVDLHVPQPEGCKEEAGKVVCENAESDVRDAKVTLPAGVTVDPSSADGLAACSEAQVGYLPQTSAEVGHPQFTPGPAECPDASKIGTVEVDTHLVDHPLPGAVYIATQQANPFKSMLALYLAVYDPQSGVVVKLPGKVTPDPVTGQLTASFDEDPQLPFEDVKLDFFSGSRATLTTPLTCGSYAANADLTPWSAPEGKEAFPSSVPFTVTGVGGSACMSSEAQAPNTPVFEAGTASPIAASYSPFVLHLKREDGSQHFSDLDVKLPPGLIGKIAGIEQCPQAAIETASARSHEGEGGLELAHPSCAAGSEVGVVHVGAGSGVPLFVTGRAYFAGPYKGAPFSLVIVTPAVAGPFDLGTVVVRAALYIDPNTAQVTVESDPFPTILDGIPLDIRDVNVDVNRKEFTLNPTSCSAMSVTGQESSMAGQTAALSDRFQAGGCTTLPFHPVFGASTSGITSRKEGASLKVQVASSVGQANIAKVHVTLPKQLPSRLETLKLACTESVFAANPASCPAGSAVGTAVAHTPILSSPLTGPVYIVSHGGAAFPDLEVVLQGEGVTIILDGKTNIQNGITESSFETVPDAPVSSFELSLPEGPHSILAAPGGGLCSLATRTVLVKKKVTVKVKRHGHVQKRRVTRTVKKTVAAGGLLMPTMIQGQNGAAISQNTPITVKGCTTSVVKHKTSAKSKHKRSAKHEKRKKRGK